MIHIILNYYFEQEIFFHIRTQVSTYIEFIKYDRERLFKHLKQLLTVQDLKESQFLNIVSMKSAR